MANDVFVRFKDKVPTDADLENIVTDFLGEAGAIEGEKLNFFMVTLSGKPSSPFKSMPDALGTYFPQDSRFIEFCTIGKGETLIVTTRGQDEYTNSVARAIARCIARYHDAEYDPG